MKKILITAMLVVSTLVFMSGCRRSDEISNINDFFISYLEVQDNNLLVEDEVIIKLESKDADDVKLNIKEYGQDESYNIIEGQESGGTWEFVYENSDPFTNEIWLTVDYDGQKVETDKKIITNIDQSYESAFESIISLSNDVDNINLLSHEVNLDILGWYDEDKLLATDNGQLILYNIYNNTKEKIMEDNIWNIYPSPNFNKIIYQDGNGLYILNISENKAQKVMDMDEGAILRDLAWSWDENKAILNILQENQDDNYIITDFRDNSSQVIDIQIQGYVLDEFFYLDNNNIFALANKEIETNDDRDFESLKTLISVDINTMRIRDYTPSSDVIDEIRVLSQVNDREFLVRISSSEISEDNIERSDIIYLLNTQDKTLSSIKEEMDFPYIYSLSPNKDQYIFLKDIEEDSNENLNEKLIVLGERDQSEIDVFQTIADYPRAFYWSENQEKIVFYIEQEKEIYLLEKASEN